MGVHLLRGFAMRKCSEEEAADRDEGDRLEHEFAPKFSEDTTSPWNGKADVEAREREEVDHGLEHRGQALGVLDIGVVVREKRDRLKSREEDVDLGLGSAP